jgi:hypothetical protein
LGEEFFYSPCHTLLQRVSQFRGWTSHFRGAGQVQGMARAVGRRAGVSVVERCPESKPAPRGAGGLRPAAGGGLVGRWGGTPWTCEERAGMVSPLRHNFLGGGCSALVGSLLREDVPGTRRAANESALHPHRTWLLPIASFRVVTAGRRRSGKRLYRARYSSE